MSIDPQIRAEAGVTKKIGSKTHTTKMKILTYTTRYHQIKEIINQIIDTGGLGSADTIVLVQQSQQLLKEMVTELLSLANGSENANLRQTKVYYFQEKGNLFQRMDEIYDLLFQQDDVSRVIGESFEREARALDYIFNATKNKNTNILIEDVEKQFNKKTTGSNQVKRDNIFISNIVIPKRWTETVIEKGEEKERVHYTIQSSSGNVDIAGFLQDKQGKVDYIFNEYDPQRSLHASLKTWGADMSERNFGKTSLMAGLLRGSSIDAALSYGLVLGWYNPQGRLKPATGLAAFHQYAKACLFVDLVSGISQQIGSFADTLVINDRSQRRIRVVSVPNLIQKVLENLESLDLYITEEKSGKSLESAVDSISIYSADQKTIQSNGYLNSLITQMGQIKLKLSGGILKLVD